MRYITLKRVLLSYLCLLESNISNRQYNTGCSLYSTETQNLPSFLQAANNDNNVLEANSSQQDSLNRKASFWVNLSNYGKSCEFIMNVNVVLLF